MPNPVAKVGSFVGYAKETTPGTGVAATTFTPGMVLQPQDVRNYTPDQGIRGSFVNDYDQIATQGWSTYHVEGPVFVDSLGLQFKSLFGDETAAGSAPTTHTFATLNSGAQPPTLSITDYNGFNARQFVYSMCSALSMSFAPDGLLNYTSDWFGFASAVVTKPTQSFTAVAAKPAYAATVSIGGSATTLMQSGQITFARNVNPITAINNTTSPTAVFGGGMSVSGNMTLIYADDTFLTPFLTGTAQALDFTWTSGSGATLYAANVHATSALFTNAVIDRTDDYIKLNVDFYCKPNTTDAGASGGYTPCKVVLSNQTSTAY